MDRNKHHNDTEMLLENIFSTCLKYLNDKYINEKKIYFSKKTFLGF